MVGGDHFDVELQGSHKLKRLEDLWGEGQDDVVVVFLDRLFQYAAVVLIRKKRSEEAMFWPKASLLIRSLSSGM